MSVAITEDRYLRIFQQLDNITATLEKLTEEHKNIYGRGPK
jgi:hypothetical protein